MNYRFQPSIPIDYKGHPTLISSGNSPHADQSVYLIINEDECDYNERVFEIKFEYSSTFSGALLVDDLLAIGYENFFCLFDIASNEVVLWLEMEWYFGYLYYNNDTFYVADASKILSIMRDGTIIWQSDVVGFDGVVIDKFTDDNIYGQGEYDPPGGWKDFILDIKTGKTLTI